MVRLLSRIKRILLSVLALLLITALAGASYQWPASRRDLAATPPPGRLVDVGGHRLHIWCTDSVEPRTPTVLFDSGLGGGAFSWAHIAPEVAKFTQTCTYDRAGMGYSDRGPTPRTSGQIAEELAELIQNSGIARPVILVGLSFGGFNTRIVASEHPDLVAGLVLVSASHEDQGERYAAAGVPSGKPPYAILKLGPIAASLGILRLMGVTFGAPPEQAHPQVREFVLAPDHILEILVASLRATILKAAVQLLVWDTVQTGRTTVAEIAEAHGLDQDGTGRLLNALCSMGLLGKNEREYELTAVSSAYLVSESPSYMGEFVGGYFGWEEQGQLAELIGSGRRAGSGTWTDVEKARVWAGFVAPHASQQPADEITEAWRELGQVKGEPVQVLDIACGAAAATLAFAARQGDVRVTLADWPAVLEVAREAAADAGIGERVEYLPGNVLEAELGRERYNLIWIGQFLHYLDSQAAVKLLNTALDGLAGGGAIILYEDLADEERAEAEYALLEDMWLYTVTSGGHVYTRRELGELLANAGLTVVAEMTRGHRVFLKAVPA